MTAAHEVPATGPRPGDIVRTPAGRLWRVVTVSRDIVRAVELDTGVLAHHDVTTLTIHERHPGGPR
ncbi:hypothetical protein [Janibacter terrae]|uniref:hypothetical protein n=1 Tax=Janibacter terrae TaxID=103817 RepID=UPI00082E5D24|nr:hypothetical protein [Janibacter terrae]